MIRVIGWIAALAVGPAVGAQSTPQKAPPGCRTFSAHETRATMPSPGAASTIVQKCEYDKAANTFTCRGDHRSAVAKYSYEMTFTFAKVEDFVGDPDRIVLFGHPQRMTMRHTGDVNAVSRATYTYDSSGWLSRLSIDTAGHKSDEIFTAWDSFGRPTAATAGRDVMAYSYDDTKRTGTMTNKTVGSETVKLFDINGIEVGQEISGPAGKVAHSWTIHSTATTCK